MALDPKKADARKRVAKGVKWLDKNVPGWVEKFTKNGLKYGFDLRDADTCVLGNVFKNAVRGEDGFYAALEKFPTLGEGSDHGFSVSHDPMYARSEGYTEEWNYLAEEWQAEILYRQCVKKNKSFFQRVKEMLELKKYKEELY